MKFSLLNALLNFIFHLLFSKAFLIAANRLAKEFQDRVTRLDEQ